MVFYGMAKSSTSGQGRPKGVPNKVTRTVREAFERAFELLQDSDVASLVPWAEKNPTEFYRLASKLIPTQIDARVGMTSIEDRLRAGRMRVGGGDA